MSGGDVGSALINDLRGGHSHLPSSGSLQPVTTSASAAAAAEAAAQDVAAEHELSSTGILIVMLEFSSVTLAIAPASLTKTNRKKDRRVISLIH